MVRRSESKELDIILRERYLRNRELSAMETVEDCKNSAYFGYNTFENLKKLM